MAFRPYSVFPWSSTSLSKYVCMAFESLFLGGSFFLSSTVGRQSKRSELFVSPFFKVEKDSWKNVPMASVPDSLESKISHSLAGLEGKRVV